MPPRGLTLPPATTASARAARSAFFCDLCQKGYSRMNEYEAHENSYDHQHKKRLKEMKEMQRQVKPQPDRKEERGPLMTIKLGNSGTRKDGEGRVGGAGSGGGGGFKKGGFKNAFKAVDDQDDDKMGGEREEKEVKVEGFQRVDQDKDMDVDGDSDITDQEDYYDPRRPTGCTPGCPGYGGG